MIEFENQNFGEFIDPNSAAAAAAATADAAATTTAVWLGKLLDELADDGGWQMADGGCESR